MHWLHNVIIIITTFLISRITIDAGLHQRLIQFVLRRSTPKLSILISIILFYSYGLSIFFPNTVVVFAIIPVIHRIVALIKDDTVKRFFSTNLVMALVYGANIGGMGSLNGSSLNIVLIGFFEIYQIPSREYITFFSWLLVGIPVTLIYIFISRLILKLGEKKITLNISQLEHVSTDVNGFIKYMVAFALNYLIIVLLSAIQFIYKPVPILQNFNWIDILFLLYLVAFIFFAFFFPRQERSIIGLFKNIVYSLSYLFLFPLIFIKEILKEIKIRFHISSKTWIKKLDNITNSIWGFIWFIIFGEKKKITRSRNDNAYISLNRMIFDLPFFGLLFFGVLSIIIYLLIHFGDDPSTPQIDSYLFHYLGEITQFLIPKGGQLFLFLLIIVLVSIFLTEFFNNTTILIIMIPIIINICSQSAINPIPYLLACNAGANGAFMTPIATSVNAIAFTSLPGISFKRVILLGLLLNIFGAVWITIVCYGLAYFF